jgi:hypothetical protein
MRKSASAVVICLFLLTGYLVAQRYASVRVGGSSLRANGQIAEGYQYSGSCPVDLKFGWGVIATGPTSVTYRFTRSDGGHSAQALVADLPQSGRSVPLYEDWRLGANTRQFGDFHGWVNLIIEGPNHLENKINFTIHCR